MADYKAFFSDIFDTEVLENEPMFKHTSFGVGGPADLFLMPNTKEAFVNCIKQAKNRQLNYYIIGNGTNVLVHDEGIRGIVISPSKLDKINVFKSKISAQAGTSLLRIAAEALDNDLTGFEFAAGIPGSVGGAVFMNAGAYGGQMADVVFKTEYLDENGEIHTLEKENHNYGYRQSFFTKNTDRVIIETTIELNKGNHDEILKYMNELAEKRRSKQPLNYKSAGSTFKRPVGNFAGKLIEDAGLKGLNVGDARVSEKHAGFIVNTGNATFKDIMELINKVKKCVYEKFEIELELEVRVI